MKVTVAASVLLSAVPLAKVREKVGAISLPSWTKRTFAGGELRRGEARGGSPGGADEGLEEPCVTPETV
ncbi:MAG: hypothetical protein U1E62_08055 [Alsobacter sp.]